MNSIILKLIIFSIINFKNIFAQLSTFDCNQKYGCFRYPGNCVDTTCSILYKWNDSGDYTNFTMSARIKSNIPLTSSWVAIAFSSDQLMGDDCATICKNTNIEQSVQQYYNLVHAKPIYLDENNPTIGIKNPEIEVNNGYLTCSFQRLKQNNNVKNYCNLNNPYFILASYGPLLRGELQEHSFKVSSNEKVNFKSNIFNGAVVFKTKKLDKAKTHGCLMVISWVLLASTAIITARYGKDILDNYRILGIKIWFIFHWPIMIGVITLSIISLLVILSDEHWKWINKNEKLEFVHSIFGIIAIFIAFFQAIISLFRCDPTDNYRFIYNYIHRFLGFTALLSAIIALFLGSVINKMKLNNTGYGLLLGWTLWLVILLISMQVIEYLDSIPNKAEEAMETKLFTVPQAVKSTLLILHVIISFSFTIVLIIIIASA